MPATLKTVDTWLTPNEAADARGLNRRLIRRWIENGKLPTSRPNGHNHLVRLADLDALLAANIRPATKGPLARQQKAGR